MSPWFHEVEENLAAVALGIAIEIETMTDPTESFLMPTILWNLEIELTAKSEVKTSTQEVQQ